MKIVNLREISVALALVLLLGGALLLPTASSEAAISVVDIPHTLLVRVKWLIAEAQKRKQLENDWLHLRRLRKYRWRDDGHGTGEFAYLGSLELANQEPDHPQPALESFAYGHEDIEPRVRAYYSGLSTFEPTPEDDLYPVASYGDLIRRRAEGRRELTANVLGRLRAHRDHLVEGAITKKEVLRTNEQARGTTQQLEALAHLSAMEVEEQMVARELQMAQVNMMALGHLEANARHAEAMLGYEETFGGSRDQPRVESEPRGLFPWSR